MTERIMRRGLAESLEEFAARIEVTPERARACWRLQGLRFLRAWLPTKLVDGEPVEHVRADSLPWEEILQWVGPDTSIRVAPGVAIPTDMPEAFL